MQLGTKKRVLDELGIGRHALGWLEREGLIGVYQLGSWSRYDLHEIEKAVRSLKRKPAGQGGQKGARLTPAQRSEAEQIAKKVRSKAARRMVEPKSRKASQRGL